MTQCYAHTGITEEKLLNEYTNPVAYEWRTLKLTPLAPKKAYKYSEILDGVTVGNSKAQPPFTEENFQKVTAFR